VTAEVTCVSKPFVVIPMAVTYVPDGIAAGQFRGGEQLVDAQQVTRQGTLLIFLAPLYKGGLDNVTPGSSCIANGYSSNHEVMQAKDTSTTRRLALHAVDALGLVHALLLRIQALLFPPFKTLVLSGLSWTRTRQAIIAHLRARACSMFFSESDWSPCWSTPAAGSYCLLPAFFSGP
jgi:hypothetical protein